MIIYPTIIFNDFKGLREYNIDRKRFLSLEDTSDLTTQQTEINSNISKYYSPLIYWINPES